MINYNTQIRIVIIIFLIITSRAILAQDFTAQSLYDNYSKYKENSISSKLIKHSSVVTGIKSVRQKKKFNVKVAGTSLNGKEIYLLSIGTGKTNVLLWSQMHGDEPTATMALFDIFNFFHANDDMNKFREDILKKLTPGSSGRSAAPPWRLDQPGRR